MSTTNTYIDHVRLVRTRDYVITVRWSQWVNASAKVYEPSMIHVYVDSRERYEARKYRPIALCYSFVREEHGRRKGQVKVHSASHQTQGLSDRGQLFDFETWYGLAQARKLARKIFLTGDMGEHETCSVCSGKRWIGADSEVCSACNATGLAPDEGAS